LHGAAIDVNDFLKGLYVREAKGLSVTPLSIFYRKYVAVPPVLGHFSDSSPYSEFCATSAPT
jgi:hypothetical protein